MSDFPSYAFPEDPLMGPGAASDYLRQRFGVSLAPRTLAKLRVSGTGPAFRRFGRAVHYERAELDRYAQEKLTAPMRSTSFIITPK